MDKKSRVLGRHQREAWEYMVLGAILVMAAGLRFWDLSQNGFGNPYYAATVRSMLMSWHNFFFVSFDPAGWVTVDKPPVSLWIQTLFAKVFGYKGFILILPQVLEGLASIALLYGLVRRPFDAWAALLAALVMALSPVSVAVDRYNNTDACLVLVLLLSAWALLRAVEKSNGAYFVLALVLAGVGFNTKMLAAFVALPVFYLAYLFGTKGTWRKKALVVALGSFALAVTALSWPLAVDLTPASQRPYVGSSQDNSMIGLSLGWNGFQRLIRGRGRGPMARPTPMVMKGPQGSVATATAPDARPFPRGNRQGRGGRFMGMMGSGEPGPLRLVDRNMAGQTAWFLPLALVGLFLAGRRVPLKLPLPPVRTHAFFWAGWFLLYAVVFSFMRGAMHAYYLVLLVPPLAALTGIGLRSLWLEFRAGHHRILALGFLLAVLWQAFIVAQFGDWSNLLLPLLLGGGAVAAISLAAMPELLNKKASAPTAVLVFSLAVLFFCPTVWALSPVLGSGTSVEANPDLYLGQNDAFGRNRGAGGNTDKLAAFLTGNHGGEKFWVGALNSQAVDQLIIQKAMPAMALGGFMGGDPIVTLDQFTQMVRDGKLRYFLLPAVDRSPGGFGGMMGNRMGSQREIVQWVKDHGQPVEPSLWREITPHEKENSQSLGFWGFRQGGNLQLYDLKPRG